MSSAHVSVQNGEVYMSLHDSGIDKLYVMSQIVNKTTINRLIHL